MTENQTQTGKRLRTQATRNSLDPGRQCRAQSRPGYTLLELLIVLAVLAALAALVLPAIRGPLDKSRLTAAAQQIQASLAKARALAIREGTSVQVRCELRGQTLRIERIPAPLLITPVNSDASQQEPNADDRNLLRSLTLPAGVHFESVQQGLAPFRNTPEVPGDSTEVAESVTPESESVSVETANLTSWGDPIVFSPDGRTQNAEIEIRGQRDFVVQIHLRGLTGFAAYDPPQRKPEVTP